MPQPCQRSASGVAGAVTETSFEAPTPDPPPRLPTCALDDAAVPVRVRTPTTSLSTPAALSMALDTSRDFGNPLFPVAKISPLRRAMNAPCGTVMHHTTPA